MARKKQTAWELNIGVKFGAVGVGAKTAGLPIHIEREHLALDRADELFCDRRLSGTILVGHTQDDPRQLDLMSVAHKIDGVFDVKGVSVTADLLKIKATFGKAEIDLGELTEFANQSGRLIVTASEEIPEPVREPSGPSAQQTFEDDEADDDSDVEDEETDEEDFVDSELEEANAG